MGNGKKINPGFILLIIISLFISFACQSDEDDVSIDYEVTATESPCIVDITYSDADGRIVQLFMHTLLLDPLVTSFTVPSDEVSGFLVFLMAKNCLTADSTDTITVTIKKDGLFFSTDTGVGTSVVVSTSGNL